MNIASAPNPAILPVHFRQTLAPFTSPQGQATPGTNALEAFLSLLTGFATQADTAEGDQAPKTGQDNKEEKKESRAVFVPVQTQQADAQPFTLVFPAAPLAPTGSLGNIAAQASLAADESALGLSMPSLPAAPRSGQLSSAPPTPTPLSSAQLSSTIDAGVQAPIAFAVRLQEAPAVQKQDDPSGLIAELKTSQSSMEQNGALSQSSLLPLTSSPVTNQGGLPASASLTEGLNVMTAPKGISRSSEGGVRPTATQDVTGKPGMSQAAVASDTASGKQQEQAIATQVHLPSGPHSVVTAVRAEPDLTRNTDAPAVTRADAQPIRTPEAEIPDTNPAFRPPPTREITMHLTPAESPSVDIKLVDRAGSIRVAVRTPDGGLARDLQSGLSDLVQRLEHKGFETEVWSPGTGSGPTPAQSAQAHGDGSASQHGAKDPRNGAQQGNSGQQSNGRNRPRWVSELEQRLAATEREINDVEDI